MFETSCVIYTQILVFHLISLITVVIQLFNFFLKLSLTVGRFIDYGCTGLINKSNCKQTCETLTLLLTSVHLIIFKTLHDLQKACNSIWKSDT